MRGRYLLGVSTLRIDRERCDGCRSCLPVCPHQVIGLEDKRAAVQALDACIECGACARNCPREAITVRAGVGCAAALINRSITGNPEACCG